MLQHYAKNSVALDLTGDAGAVVALGQTASRTCTVVRSDKLGELLVTLQRHKLGIIFNHGEIAVSDYRRLADDWADGQDDQTRIRGRASHQAVCVHQWEPSDLGPSIPSEALRSIGSEMYTFALTTEPYLSATRGKMRPGSVTVVVDPRPRFVKAFGSVREWIGSLAAVVL